jgi:hypothetical protein
VKDDLVNDGGIMDLWTREARIFKYGSGTGSNFSLLRGENEALSGGGKSSGLMSFLKIGDRAAGAIKSGGTTRRAAKMVCLDLDHPDVMQFIRWKVVEEQKVAALVAGSRLGKRRLQAVLQATRTGDRVQADPKQNPGLRAAMREARAAFVPEAYIQKTLHLAASGVTEIVFPEYDTDWDSEAYLTVSGQNSNNSIRVPSSFFDVLDKGGNWELRRRTDGKISKTFPPPRSGTRSPTRPGPARTRGCSTTPPSTSGTPVPRTAASMRAIRARSTCSSTTPRATSPPSISSSSWGRTAASMSRASAMPAGCGRWCSRSACSWPPIPAR